MDREDTARGARNALGVRRGAGRRGELRFASVGSDQEGSELRTGVSKDWPGGAGVRASMVAEGTREVRKDRMKAEHVRVGVKLLLLVSYEWRAPRREVSLRVDIGAGAEE
jgi:hypothetical protein